MSADNQDNQDNQGNYSVMERFKPVEAVVIAACLCALAGSALYFGQPGVALATVVALAFVFRP